MMEYFRADKYIRHDESIDSSLSKLDDEFDESLPEGYSPLAHMSAGALAGIMEHSVLFPIDSLKTRLQVFHPNFSSSALSSSSGSYVPVNCESVKGPAQIYNTFGNVYRQTKSLTSLTYQIVKNEGFHRLYRGLPLAAIGAGPAHALYFGAYEWSKKNLNQVDKRLNGAIDVKSELSPFWVTGLSGALATFFHDGFMTPFDVIKQRMQVGYAAANPKCPENSLLQKNCAKHAANGAAVTSQQNIVKYKSSLHCLQHTVRNEGVSSLFLSLPTTLMMNIPYQVIQFSVYEVAKVWIGGFMYGMKKSESSDTGGSSSFTLSHTDLAMVHILSGGLAGSTAAFLTTPLDVVKTLLQTRSVSECGRLRSVNGIGDLMKLLVGGVISKKEASSSYFNLRTKKGIISFGSFLWRGAKARSVGAFPATGLSWLVYEYFKRIFKPENI